MAYWPMRALPDFKERPAVLVPLRFEAVEMAAAVPPLRLAGAWTMQVHDPRFHGISALAIDQGRFLAATDLGAVIRFDMPAASHPRAMLKDLRFGPGKFGPKWARDAESIARDLTGRGWWIGFEQNHSLWLYDSSFRNARASVDLNRPDWWYNRGAEGLIPEGAGLLVLAENGREAMPVRRNRIGRVSLAAGADVADAARAPDGSAWLLLRTKGLNGISQAIARLNRTQAGYRAGPAWPVPKGLFDNYEGMAIERRPGGGLRFWLVTDDGHRIMARNLLVALDYLPSEHGQSPATSAGPSKLQPVETP
ncbi:esterase-like activity of phytase family protein [Sphingomonas sp. RB56-2]|uniref:Esterase-like activity of phytase family protein n=1 Tax=Sphingomonas brevis TaxID=2908206 RepID=A0ABT0SA33_9SPHN|nr:esterase-like activity of phytase family protein [Sphingomonas brevis]MCL6741270.1 esterase-like activity of phytase family protein [Sphingomonas brevis]